MNKILILSCILLTGVILHAQPNLDSLWTIWNDNHVTDTARAQAMNEICRQGYLYSQPDSAFYYAQILYEFANNKKLRKEMALAKRTQGISYFIRSDYPKALDYFERSLTISKEISDKNGMAGSLNNIGVIYRNMGYYPKALDYYQRCLKVMEDMPDKSRMAYILNNIGVIYINEGEYSRAMEHYKRSLDISSEISDKNGISIALDNIGVVYRKMGDFAKALDYYNQSLKIMKEITDKGGIATVLKNIGDVYMDQGEFSQAIEYFQQSLTFNQDVANGRGIVTALVNIGIAKCGQGNYTDAVFWCKKGLLKAEEINTLEGQKEACECLYKAYKAKDDPTRALQYHEQAIILADSLQMAETTKKLEQMEFARQVSADSLHNEEEKIKIRIAYEKEVRRKNRTRNAYILSALFILVLGVWIHQRMISNKRARRIIEKEKIRSDELLLNILPTKIAEELKEKGNTEARKIDNVSILFSDFKGFSRISEELSARELVTEINNCFEPFDIICKKYGIEKIKTIGDSYMAAGGLPGPETGSVKNTVLAGLEMIEVMNKRKEERKALGKVYFEMRLGIHTGQVIAGIVGLSKFQYDIWGDAVNIASRMENAGEVGKVNISRNTFDFIKDDPLFKFHPRGFINVKGKGKIEMWFVEKAG